MLRHGQGRAAFNLAQPSCALGPHRRVWASLHIEGQLAERDDRGVDGKVSRGADQLGAINLARSERDPDAAIENRAHGLRTSSSQPSRLSFNHAEA